MSSEFDKIKQDIHDFNARIKTWNEDTLSDEEAEEVDSLLEETIELITGAAMEDEDGDEEDDFELE